MKVSAIPTDEEQRLAAVLRFQILDTGAEKDFDDIVELASQLCDCSISLITIIDVHRQWFKAKTGVSIAETNRDIAFCAHTIHYDDILMVPDTSADDRFYDNPLVTGEEAVRFYAGMPLMTSDGYKLGSLCVLDKQPKNLTVAQLSGLRILGKQVVNLLNLRFSILQLNKTIEEKTARATEILNRVGDGFAALDQDWRYTYLNQKAHQLVNRTSENLIGKHIWTEFPALVGQPVYHAYKKAMDEQRYVYFEEYYAPFDRWIENHIYASPSGISVYFRDVTERKKREILIRQSEEKFRSLVEYASDGIFIADEQGNYVDVNGNGCALLGYSKNEILKFRIQDLLVDDSSLPPRLNELKEGKAILSLRKMRRKDGSEISVEVNAKMLPDGRILGIVRDNTARLRAEQKLVTEKELSDQIINSLPGIFYLSDPTPRLVRWNKKLETISEYSAEELRKMVPITLFEPSEQGRIRDVLEKTYVQGNGSAETTLVSKSGKRTSFFFTGVRIEYEGKPALLGTGIDITDQKKAQEEILKANELFSLVTKATNDVVWDWNLITNQFWWNQNFYSHFGYDEQKISMELASWLNSIHPEDVERVTSHIRHLIDTHVYYYEQEYRFLKGNGAILFVFDRGYILYDPAGKPYRMIGAMMDVTQRKQTELELAAKESHLRTILTTEPECIKLLNNNGELLEMNPAGLAMIEADSEEQVKGSTLDRLIFDPYKEPFKNLIKKVFQGESGTLEFEMTGLKGTQRWLETHAVPLKDTAGKIISLLGVTRDVTKRRNAEELLRAAEERFRNIFENATEGIYQSTPEGRFITANSSLARMFGYESASELMSSMTHIGLQLYADPSEREYVIDRLAKQDRITGFEMRAFKKNNDIIWVRDHIHAVRDPQGNLLYFEGTLEDITERRNAEDKLKHQFDELQKTNYELDRFVYSVSHDLRAPLSSILGLVMVAELEKPSESHQKYLELIRQSVNRLDGFIHDILDYSRNARTTVTTQKINWRGLMQAAGENLKQLQGMDRLVIRSNINDEIPFFSDRVRIEIILNNLLSNAVKYQDATKDSSTLDVRIDTTRESANIVFRDNGIGIDNENLKHIFDMFYRASSQSKGSGLGLYITRETVSKLAGTISVKSELGQFTAIEISIPNLPEPALHR